MIQSHGREVYWWISGRWSRRRRRRRRGLPRFHCSKRPLRPPPLLGSWHHPFHSVTLPPHLVISWSLNRAEVKGAVNFTLLCTFTFAVVHQTCQTDTCEWNPTTPKWNQLELEMFILIIDCVQLFLENTLRKQSFWIWKDEWKWKLCFDIWKGHKCFGGDFKLHFLVQHILNNLFEMWKACRCLGETSSYTFLSNIS